MKQHTRSRPIVLGAAGAILLAVTVPATAQAQETPGPPAGVCDPDADVWELDVPWSGALVGHGDPLPEGTLLTPVPTTTVPAEFVGRSVLITASNNNSMNADSDIIVYSPADVQVPFIIPGVEDAELTTVVGGPTTLGETLRLSIEIGPDGYFSADNDAVYFCTTDAPPPEPTPTPTPTPEPPPPPAEPPAEPPASPPPPPSTPPPSTTPPPRLPDTGLDAGQWAMGAGALGLLTLGAGLFGWSRRRAES